MTEERESLGSLALRQNNGVPNAALADLMTQVVGMAGFINHEGIPKDVVLECFDDMVKTSRQALVDLMERNDGASRT